MKNKKNPTINVLMVTPVYPFPMEAGPSAYQYNLVKSLHKLPGINLHLLSYYGASSKRSAEYDSLCEKSRFVKLPGGKKRPGPYSTGIYLIDYFVTPGMVRTLKEMLAETRYDVVQFEHIQMAPYAGLLEEAGFEGAAVLVEYDCLGVAERQKIALAGERDPAEKSRMSGELDLLNKFQKQVYRRFANVVVFSEEDARWVGKNCSGAGTSVIPVAVDTAMFASALFEKKNGDTLLFVGSATHPSTAPSLESVLKKIFPAVLKKNPSAKLVIAGKGMEKLVKGAESPNITVLGYIEDIVDAYRGADVLIAPVWDCGGTRTKILEAMASGVSVVTTPIGARGIAAKDGVEILIGGNTQELTAQALRLLGDSALRREISRKARRLVREKHSWDASAGKCLDLYLSLKK